ncbi:ligand-binding protein, receptor family [Necator americanus]|uniref:Ligand-binding protein, receptor family n=1 Tax=Necator americanus TaxID=51031 RepID=W2TAS5_NECAM|nr:ligand-binding protein, receptor family [Necator americanus]ETN78958.1 ligand-binding protein, receptor family [Necator americanus]
MVNVSFIPRNAAQTVMVGLIVILVLVVATPFCMCITIDVGVVIPRGNVSYAGSIAYETSAAALEIGREEVLRQQLLDGHDFSNCSDVQAVGSAAKLILEQKIFALIGPACNLAAVATAPLSTYFNVPTYVWGLTTSSAINIKKYPSVITMTTTGSHYAVALAHIVKHFGWDQFAFIYAGEKCSDISHGLAAVLYRMVGKMFTSRSTYVPNPNSRSLEVTLSRTRDVARIIALCLSEPHAIRTALLASFDLGMTTNEFLYIIVNSQSGGYVLGSHGKLTPIWKDVSSTPDGRDDDALQAYLRTMSASLDSYQLYNIVILYAKSLNRTISEDISQLRNGTLIIKNSEMTIQGISGPVTINDLAQLVATLTVSIADRKGEPQKILSVRINHDKVNITTFVSDPEEVWSNYGGVKPLDVPQCGLQGEKCTSIFGKDPHVFASLLVVSLLVTVLFAAIGIHIWREKVMHEKEINMKWLVPFTALQKMVNKVGEYVEAKLAILN